MTRGALCAALLLAAGTVHAQQAPDRDYHPALARPAYASMQGPVVCVDQAHFNFHTLGERFWAFGELLRRDGYRLVPNKAKLDAGALAACAVLVISNAQPSDAEWDQYPSPTPSAFTDKEIAAVHRWVKKGGALLLIADHMPLAGAAAKLAAAFEVEFVDGFALRDPANGDPDVFSIESRTLRTHAITRGRSADESITRIRTFTGQAFRAPNAAPLLVIPAGFVQLTPKVAWQFTPDTPRSAVEGWLQGAVQTVGKGRAAFFGEAAMFSAQLAGAEHSPMGMNAPGAEQNFQFVLNVVHWLTRTL
jgi:uncharacterized protein (DUF2249 family)